MTRQWLALVCATAAVTIALPDRTRAQSCCTATSPGELGIVGPCDDAVVAMQLGGEYALASFDDRGSMRSLSSTRAIDTQLTLGAGVRVLHRRLQVNGSLPLRLQHRAMHGLDSSTALGAGDATLGLRWTAIRGADRGFDTEDASSYVPIVALYITQRFPLGRAPQGSTDPTGADITGDGRFESLIGARITSFLTMRHALALNAGYGIRFGREFATDNGTQSVATSSSYNLQLTWMYHRDMFSTFGGWASARWVVQPESGSSAGFSDQSRRVRVGAFFTHSISYPDWELTTTLASDLLISGAAANVPFAGLLGSLMLQRAF